MCSYGFPFHYYLCYEYFKSRCCFSFTFPIFLSFYFLSSIFVSTVHICFKVFLWKWKNHIAIAFCADVYALRMARLCRSVRYCCPTWEPWVEEGRWLITVFGDAENWDEMNYVFYGLSQHIQFGSIDDILCCLMPFAFPIPSYVYTKIKSLTPKVDGIAVLYNTMCIQGSTCSLHIHLNVFPFRLIVHWAICKHSATLNGRERCHAGILMLWHSLFTFCTCIAISRGLTLCQASSVHSDNTGLWYRFHVKLLQSSYVETLTLGSLMCMFIQGKQILCHCIWLGIHADICIRWSLCTGISNLMPLQQFMLNPPRIASVFSHSAALLPIAM